ncbi:MAG: glycogen/starch synthase [Salibacteraceae bacterium]
MSKVKVLYVSQEITPYVPESEMSTLGRFLPQRMMEKGMEIRTFMPRFGKINTRRHQLHEVIRLSGINLVVNDVDHPLIIKVASIQPARMQVYFIDNEEYFQRKAFLIDEIGEAFPDNDERSIFFVKGVLETVKKLGWSPDIIHCHGWMASLLPVFLKTMYKDDPLFNESKIVYSAFSDIPNGDLDHQLKSKLQFDGVGEDILKHLDSISYDGLHKTAIELSDAIVVGDENLSDDVKNHIDSKDCPVLIHENDPDEYGDPFEALYNEILDTVPAE